MLEQASGGGSLSAHWQLSNPGRNILVHRKPPFRLVGWHLKGLRRKQLPLPGLDGGEAAVGHGLQDWVDRGGRAPHRRYGQASCCSASAISSSNCAATARFTLSRDDATTRRVMSGLSDACPRALRGIDSHRREGRCRTSLNSSARSLVRLRGGAHTSQSNEAFDASLRARNPLWGVRDIDKVAEVAGTEGLVLEKAVPMPANNFTLVWRKSNGAFRGARAP